MQSGCGVDFAYLIPAAGGQLELLLRTVPVDQALASGNLDEETVRRLQLVQDVRAFARDEVGLTVGDHYTTFYDSGGEPVAYNLSASRKDSFQPFVWTFPFVGTVPYLGFFDVEPAFARRDQLAALGYDVFIYEIDAYYALGVFPNPILSPMLARPEESLIDTVIHELLHATILRPNDTAFNESLATFVGRTGAAEFLERRYADEPQRRDAALARFADSDRYSTFILELYNELDTFYRSDLSFDAKVLGRNDVYQTGRDRFAAEVLPLMNLPDNYAWVANLPANNAFMLGVRRYNLDLVLFDGVYQAVGRDWRSALAVYREAARAADGYAFMRAWLAGDANLRVASPGDASPDELSQSHDSAPCDIHRATTLVPRP
jgi:predicted aminopeptidase